jgi:mono/diheme cytochrome c family protein
MAIAEQAFSVALLLTASTLASAGAHAAEPKGDALFATHCAACHGSEGEGGGPVASVMNVTTPNLRTLAKRNGGVFPAEAVAAYIDGRKQVAAHGDRVMPVWGDLLQTLGDKNGEEGVRARINALVSFIERLQYR